MMTDSIIHFPYDCGSIPDLNLPPHAHLVISSHSGLKDPRYTSEPASLQLIFPITFWKPLFGTFNYPLLL